MEGVLQSSYAQACVAGLARADWPGSQDGWVPFEAQTPVQEGENVFQMPNPAGGALFLASEFGAASTHVFHCLGISAVVNAAGGPNGVPNHFEAEGVAYVSYALQDQPGENILAHGIREGTVRISEFLAQQKRVMVHCSAGLSRSATIVVAWMMRELDLTLAQAVAQVTAGRGRQLQINPSFWMSLAQWERELRPTEYRAGVPPSFDFMPWLLEHFGDMGFQPETIRQAVVWADWTDFEKALDAMLAGT
jgi:protein-tyrosine phosphatase